MRKIVVGWAVVALATLSGAAVAPALAQDAPARMAFVSLERILRDSMPAKAAQARLDAEFSQRQKDLQDEAAKIKPLYDYLEKNSSVMSDSERDRRQRELADQEKDFQRRQRELSEDVNQRKNEELQGIVSRASQAIKQIAETDHYDLIFQDAVYTNPRVDITDQVIKVLNSQPAAAPAASSPAPASK